MKTGQQNTSFLIALFLLLNVACSGPAKNGGETSSKPPAAAAPKITHFYANDPVIRGKGQSTLICYGTEQSTEVTLEPPVERLWPASSRCFSVTPAQKTTYTITAKSAAGQTQQTLTIDLGPPAAKILELRVDSTEVKPGAVWQACVKAQNVSSWTLSAGKWIQGPGPTGGCFRDMPKFTTTYVVQATGALGETDTEQITLTVR